MFDSLMGYLKSLFGWIADLAYDVGMWVWEQIFKVVKAVGMFLWNQLDALMPDYVKQYLTGAADPISRFNGDTLRQYINGIDWFLPVYSTLGIIGSALLAVGAIRTLRWVKAFIPTIDS